MPFSSNWKKKKFAFILGACLIIGALLRLISFSWGLPEDYFHVSLEEDEEIYLEHIKGMDILALDLDPNLYLHGPVVAYLWEFSLGVARIFGLANHEIDKAHYAKNPRDYTNIILSGRMVSLLIGLALIFVVAFAFKQKFGGDTALLAAALIAVTWEPVNHSHIVRHDLPMALALTLMLAQAYKVAGLGRRRDYVWMGILLGLNIAIIHIAGIWLGGILFLSAHLLLLKKKGDWNLKNVFSVNMFLSLLCAMAAFLVLVPFVIFNFKDYVAVFFQLGVPSMREQDVWRVTDLTTGLRGIWFLLTSVLGHAVGFIFAFVSLAAIAYGWWKKRTDWLLLLILPSVQFLSLSLLTQKFTRHLVFVIPPLAILTARFLLYDFRGFLDKRLGVKSGPVLWLFIILMIGGSLAQTLAVTWLQEKGRTPDKVTNWMEENIPDNAIIGTIEAPVSNLIPPLSEHFSPDGRPKYMLISEIGRNISTVKKSDAQYIVDPHFMIYGLHNKYRNEDRYPNQSNFIKWLESEDEFVMVKTFENAPGFLGLLYDIETLPLDMHRVNLKVNIYQRKKGVIATP